MKASFLAEWWRKLAKVGRGGVEAGDGGVEAGDGGAAAAAGTTSVVILGEISGRFGNAEAFWGI